MTRVEMKNHLLKQRAGYEWYDQFLINEARNATPEDRLNGLRQIWKFNQYLPDQTERDLDHELTQKWINIRKKYDNSK